MLTRHRSAPVFAVLAVVLAACNDFPVDTQCEGFTLQVAETQTSREPIMLDFLWVVDDSTSMCQEQASLAESIDTFVNTLETFANVDIRTAVVTTSYLVEENRGRFNRSWATEFPPLCQERRAFPARQDLHCQCAACAGWDDAFAYQCAQDTELGCIPRDPDAQAPKYLQCVANLGCTPDLVSDSVPADQREAVARLASQWVYEPVQNLASVYNLNGSVNVNCRFDCGLGQPTLEQAREVGARNCRDWFGEDSMVCQAASLESSGCVKPPDTTGCPEELPAVLPAVLPADPDGRTLQYGIEYFPCIATVGAEQDLPYNLEQGMRQAWTALYAGGPHPLQVCEPDDPVLSEETLSDDEKRARCERTFLRRNAFLIIVFVTDEEDCSVADGKTIAPEDYNRCGLLGDIDTEPSAGPASDVTDARPLAPVYQYANRLRSLKQNPANVFVAAIVGDAWSPAGALSPEEIDDERALFFESKTDRTNMQRLNTSICSSAFGRADLGLRYIELTEQFGPHGFRANICSNQGIGPALEDIAEELISEVVTICLPRPVRRTESDETPVDVYKTAAAEGAAREHLVQGRDFQVVDESEEGACPGSGRAIRFEKGALPLPEDTLEIRYEAEVDCGF